ncbi:helix-turn-helix domain-containing protein [Nocardia sp. NPDC052112]|uniref:helix-turn-helix domain-containing protein n=1 Tax=Nocardia sp. NPDC052112 TaxID=3155646 RepID=UPI003417BFFE
MQQPRHPPALDDLATSVRTPTRRFHEETGLSPQKWLLHQRIQRARELLESTTTLPMDTVARHSGIGSAESLRQHMIRHVGLPNHLPRLLHLHPQPIRLSEPRGPPGYT